MDKAHFHLHILQKNGAPIKLQKFSLVLFFDGIIERRCFLSLPAAIIVEHAYHTDFNNKLIIKGDVALVQKYEFHCPLLGRNTGSYFKNEILSINSTNIEQYSLENIRKSMKLSEGYIELHTKETYSRESLEYNHTSIDVELDIGQLPVRYHSSFWEHIGIFWLYFASFVGLSFYITNRIKDFVFSKHWVNSWEIIPWKKLY